MLALVVVVVSLSIVTYAQWARPQAAAIPQADGFVKIPDAAFPIDKNSTFRAVFDATRAASKPDQIVPALNMAGAALNDLASEGAPLGNARFVVVFHGPAVDGILDDAHYRAKYKIANPNLAVLSELKKAGVEIYVCGQHLAGENIDPKTLSPDVKVATDALIVLMTLQNKGYALMAF
ncbi:MAG TPA: DsrE family protein [Humisphaera sp.]|nr:DsrE family protein [Humisphaera sp.]